MNPKHTNLLRLVIESGSPTIAASRLGISQPAVTKTLQQAEQQLGFPLFLRQRGRLLPTVEARALLPELIRASAAFDAVNRLAEDLRGFRTGTVTVATTPAPGNSIVTRAVGRFRARHSRVHVDVQSRYNHEVVAAVADRRVDFGLAFAPVDDAHLAVQEICTADLICVMPRDHALAAATAIRARDLEPYPLVSFSRQRPIGALAEAAFRAAGLRRTVAIHVSQSPNACALVHVGAGIAILDGLSADFAVALGLVVRPFVPRASLPILLLLPEGGIVSRQAEELIREIKDAAAAFLPTGTSTTSR